MPDQGNVNIMYCVTFKDNSFREFGQSKFISLCAYT